jgi:hypothetical protein
MNDLPPPIPPTPTEPAPGSGGRWYRRRVVKLPVWVWIAIGIVIVGSLSSGSGSSDSANTPSPIMSAISPTTSDSLDADVSSSVPQPAPTTDPPAPTSTSPRLKTIGSGTYIVGAEIEPGRYRVSGYFARLDSSMEIIDNDGVYSDNAFTFVEVQPTDAYLEISGEAATLEDFRAYLIAVSGQGAYNPLVAGAEEGTYIVNEDVLPGRYRVENSSYAYAARLTCDRDIIDNEGNSGSVIIIVQPTDCLFEFSGTLTPLP